MVEALCMDMVVHFVDGSEKKVFHIGRVTFGKAPDDSRSVILVNALAGDSIVIPEESINFIEVTVDSN